MYTILLSEIVVPYDHRYMYIVLLSELSDSHGFFHIFTIQKMEQGQRIGGGGGKRRDLLSGNCFECFF